jgi:hypothetical protein
MFILKSLLGPLQTEFKQDTKRGKLFISVLLGILFPVSGSRNSQLLRIIHSLFGLKITARRFYIFMASPKLPWERLWHCLWLLIPSPLTDGRLILAADDSMNPKTGKHIHGCDYHFDHAAKTNQSKYVWSQNIVKIGLLKWIHGRFACLPLAWCFYHLKKESKNFETKLEQVVQMVFSLYRFFKHPILLTADNWFAAKTLVKPIKKELGDAFHLLSRLRTNTKLFDTKIPKYSGRGRPAKYGKCIGNVKQQGKTLKKKSQRYSVFLYGKQREVNATSKIVFLKTLGMSVHVVWIYHRKRTVALFATDLSLTIEKIITYYGARWKIESGFKELKQDIGSRDAQVQTQNAVTNHLNFCMMAVTFTWIYATRLKKSPVRRNKNNRRNSFAFSDVRYTISQVFSNSDFLKVLFHSHKTTKNISLRTLIKLAA